MKTVVTTFHSWTTTHRGIFHWPTSRLRPWSAGLSQITLGVMSLMAALVVQNTSRAAGLQTTKPVCLPEPINDEYYDGGPTVTGDGLALYFASNRPGGRGGLDIWVSRRASQSDLWGPPVNLDVVNTAGHEYTGAVSRDERELYFSRADVDGLQSDIWVTTRSTIQDNWAEPVKLGSAVNSERWFEDDPFISADKLELYFDSNRTGMWQVFVSRRGALTEEFGPPRAIPGEGSYACVSSNGLLLFQFNTEASADIIYKTRTSVLEDFGVGRLPIRGLNTAYRDADPWIMADGTLYFVSNSPGKPRPPNQTMGGQFGIWQASLMPQLACTKIDVGVRLSWPTFPEGFHLESSSSLTAPWLPVYAEPMESEDLFEHSLPSTCGSQFFRLKKD